MTEQEYTLEELVNSTRERMKYNLVLASTHPDPDERKRFERNAIMFEGAIEYAIKQNDKEVLMDNRDW